MRLTKEQLDAIGQIADKSDGSTTEIHEVGGVAAVTMPPIKCPETKEEAVKFLTKVLSESGPLAAIMLARLVVKSAELHGRSGKIILPSDLRKISEDDNHPLADELQAVMVGGSMVAMQLGTSLFIDHVRDHLMSKGEQGEKLCRQFLKTVLKMVSDDSSSADGDLSQN